MKRVELEDRKTLLKKVEEIELGLIQEGRLADGSKELDVYNIMNANRKYVKEYIIIQAKKEVETGEVSDRNVEEGKNSRWYLSGFSKKQPVCIYDNKIRKEVNRIIQKNIGGVCKMLLAPRCEGVWRYTVECIVERSEKRSKKEVSKMINELLALYGTVEKPYVVEANKMSIDEWRDRNRKKVDSKCTKIIVAQNDKKKGKTSLKIIHSDGV